MAGPNEDRSITDAGRTTCPGLVYCPTCTEQRRKKSGSGDDYRGPPPPAGAEFDPLFQHDDDTIGPEGIPCITNLTSAGILEWPLVNCTFSLFGLNPNCLSD